MKRSEMVINIAIELMSRLPEWEKQERLNFASEILQCIEMQGMLPPHQDGDKYYHCYECGGDTVFNWESEDETPKD